MRGGAAFSGPAGWQVVYLKYPPGKGLSVAGLASSGEWKWWGEIGVKGRRVLSGEMGPCLDIDTWPCVKVQYLKVRLALKV